MQHNDETNLSVPKTKKRYQIGTTEGSCVKHISVAINNKIGSFGNQVKLLEDKKIHVLGMSLHDACDISVLRMIVSDPERTKEIFHQKKINFVESDVIIVQLTNGAAGLNKCLSYLLYAECNIYFCYALLCMPNDLPLLAISTDEIDFASQILNQNGYKLLKQEDLSR